MMKSIALKPLPLGEQKKLKSWKKPTLKKSGVPTKYDNPSWEEMISKYENLEIPKGKNKRK